MLWPLTRREIRWPSLLRKRFTEFHSHQDVHFCHEVGANFARYFCGFPGCYTDRCVLNCMQGTPRHRQGHCSGDAEPLHTRNATPAPHVELHSFDQRLSSKGKACVAQAMPSLNAVFEGVSDASIRRTGSRIFLNARERSGTAPVVHNYGRYGLRSPAMLPTPTLRAHTQESRADSPPPRYLGSA